MRFNNDKDIRNLPQVTFFNFFHKQSFERIEKWALQRIYQMKS